MNNSKKVEYNDSYNKKNYAEYKIRVPKNEKDNIEKHYKEIGYKSFNKYANDLIFNDIYKNK